jgi:hypothetical protein
MTEIEVRRVRRYETELGIELRRVRMREGRVIDAGTSEALEALASSIVDRLIA